MNPISLRFVVTRVFPLIVWMLSQTNVRAELLEFPQHLCTIDLPASVKWEILKSSDVGGNENVLAAISADRKIAVTIVVQDVFPTTKEDRDKFFAGARFGLTKGGWKITGERDQPFGELRGHFIGAKSVRDGITSVQTSFYLFANNRTYTISAAIVAEKVTPDLVKHASDCMAGFSLLPTSKTP